MIYLTKEWGIKLKQLFLDKGLRCNKSAEQFSEKFYINTYRRKFIQCKNTLKDMPTNFATKFFGMRYRYNLKGIELLPEYILKEIADTRILALGYVSKKVKQLLEEYCKKIRIDYNRIVSMARTKTLQAKSKLLTAVDIVQYEGWDIKQVCRKKNDILLVFVMGTLKIIDGEILECELTRLHKKKSFDMLANKVVFTEISFENGRFSVHFLVENENEKGGMELSNLTIRGANIIQRSS